MKKLLKSFFSFICTEFSALPKVYQIAYYNVSSAAFAAVTTALLADLANLEVANTYARTAVLTLVGLLDVTFNVLQYKVAKYGESLGAEKKTALSKK